MQFSLLGPLEVTDGEQPITVGGGNRRGLLALLLLNANEVVSGERLIDELWGERPPATAAKSLHVYVSQLRKELACGGAGPNGSVLLTRGSGYIVQLSPDELDVLRFQKLVGDGRRALDDGRAESAAQRLRDALALWRGPALSDFRYESFAQRYISRLEEERLSALETRIEADLALGRHAEIVGELEDLVADHPLREHLRAHYMLALYRCGRQADALASYRAGRARLSDDLGLEPGPELRELESAILAQSPALAAPTATRAPTRAPGPTPPRRFRWRTAAVIGAASILLVAAGLAALAEDEPERAARATPRLDLARNAIAVVSPRDGSLRLALPLPGRPTDLAADGDGAWTVTLETSALTRVDARTREITHSTPLRLDPGAVAVGAGAVWVADGRRGELVSVVPGYDDVSPPIEFRRGPPPKGAGPDRTSIAAGAGGVWVTDASERLVRVDPRTRRPTAIDVGVPLDGVTVGSGAVWAISGRDASVLRIDPATNRVTNRIAIAERPGEDTPKPASIAASDGAIWVLNRNTATVARIDPTGRGISAVIPIGVDRVPNEIAAAGQTAWVANEDGSLSRIDEDAREARSVWVGESLRQTATNGTRLWVGTASLDQQMPGGVG